MSEFSRTLDSILEQARSGELEKQAAAAEAARPKREVVGSDAQALVKIASMVREVSSEPTYEDIHKFIRSC